MVDDELILPDTVAVERPDEGQDAYQWTSGAERSHCQVQFAALASRTVSRDLRQSCESCVLTGVIQGSLEAISPPVK